MRYSHTIKRLLPTAKSAVVAMLIFAVSVPAGTAAAADKFNAGFVVIPKPNNGGMPEIGVWYPSRDNESKGKVGKFPALLARKGAPAEGVFPVIVMSHGFLGRYHVHRYTAAELARAGYVVVAPQHTTDKRIRERKGYTDAVNLRSEQLRIALDAAKAHSRVGGVMDDKRVGVVGFSMGGMTALLSAGANSSVRAVQEHCKKHGNDDKIFCRRELKVQDGDFRLDAPVDFRAAALVAPIGALFSSEQLQGVGAAVGLFRFGKDKVLRYPYHAEHLHSLMGGRVKFYKTYPDAHHLAFTSVPGRSDPPGFDRKGFMKEINADIVGFFLENL